MPSLPPPPATPFRVDPATFPANNAELVLDFLFKPEDRRTLIYHRQEFLLYTGTHYERIAPDFLESRISWYFENAEFWWPGTQQQAGEWRKFPVNNSALDNIMRAIRNKVVVAESVDFNSWLDPVPGDPNPVDLIPCRNGLLNTVTRELLPHTPRFLSTYSLTFDYDANAAVPADFFAFLRSCFADDAERIGLVQQMLAYLLTPRMDLQKMFVLNGPIRSGKGTIARLIEKLVGRENYGATSLSMLGETHGLENIATKPVVVLGDAAFTGRNAASAQERLLGIIGQDSIPVNPKGKRMYSAVLPCRFLLLANGLPELPDKSQALRARWVHLKFTESFLGREDRTLDGKLAAELPGIFKWALAGLDSLRLSGQFIVPELGTDDLDDLTAIVNPHSTFVRELCEIGPEFREANADLYLAGLNWGAELGLTARELGSAAAFVKRVKQQPECARLGKGKTLVSEDPHGQRNATVGIRLTPEAKERYLVPTELFEMRRATDIPTQLVSDWHRS